MAKLKNCKTCNSEISSNAKRCPHCGGKIKKPFFLRWWFILLAIIAILITILSSPNDNGKTKTPDSYYDDFDYSESFSSTSDAISNSGNDSSVAEASDSADSSAPESNNSIRPEFKETLDSYEKFFDEYCDFMEAYYKSDNALGLMDEYLEYMSQYTDTMSKLSALEDSEMNDAELQYYIEVHARITKKLLEVTP